MPGPSRIDIDDSVATRDPVEWIRPFESGIGGDILGGDPAAWEVFVLSWGVLPVRRPGDQGWDLDIGGVGPIDIDPDANAISHGNRKVTLDEHAIDRLLSVSRWWGPSVLGAGIRLPEPVVISLIHHQASLPPLSVAISTWPVEDAHPDGTAISMPLWAGPATASRGLARGRAWGPSSRVLSSGRAVGPSARARSMARPQQLPARRGSSSAVVLTPTGPSSAMTIGASVPPLAGDYGSRHSDPQAFPWQSPELGHSKTDQGIGSLAYLKEGPTKGEATMQMTTWRRNCRCTPNLDRSDQEKRAGVSAGERTMRSPPHGQPEPGAYPGCPLGREMPVDLGPRPW